MFGLQIPVLVTTNMAGNLKNEPQSPVPLICNSITAPSASLSSHLSGLQKR